MTQPRIHADAALDAVLDDELVLRRARRRRAVRNELTAAEGAASRTIARAAGRGARNGAVAAGATGVLLAPGMSGVAAATPPAEPIGVHAVPEPVTGPAAEQTDAPPPVASAVVDAGVVDAHEDAVDLGPPDAAVVDPVDDQTQPPDPDVAAPDTAGEGVEGAAGDGDGGDAGGLAPADAGVGDGQDAPAQQQPVQDGGPDVGPTEDATGPGPAGAGEDDEDNEDDAAPASGSPWEGADSPTGDHEAGEDVAAEVSLPEAEVSLPEAEVAPGEEAPQEDTPGDGSPVDGAPGAPLPTEDPAVEHPAAEDPAEADPAAADPAAEDQPAEDPAAEDQPGEGQVSASGVLAIIPGAPQDDDVPSAIGGPADEVPEGADVTVLPADHIDEALSEDPADTPGDGSQADDGEVGDVGGSGEETEQPALEVVHEVQAPTAAPAPSRPAAAAPTRPARPVAPQARPAVAPTRPARPVAAPAQSMASSAAVVEDLTATITDGSLDIEEATRPPGAGSPVVAGVGGTTSVAGVPARPDTPARVAVDPAFSPNDAPSRREPAPTPPPMDAATPDAGASTTSVEDKIAAARSRPVDAVRISDWARAVTRAWTAIQDGSTTDVPLVAVSDDIAPRPTIGLSYQIQPGDSLWGIAQAMWGDHPVGMAELDATWHLLFTWNAEALGFNPDLLVHGVVLQIPADIAR